MTTLNHALRLQLPSPNNSLKDSRSKLMETLIRRLLKFKKMVKIMMSRRQRKFILMQRRAPKTKTETLNIIINL